MPNVFNSRLITRAIIEMVSLRINDYDNLELTLNVNSVEGHANLAINLTRDPKMLYKVFKIFKIRDFNRLVGQPCIVLLDKGCIKDITNLLWTDYSSLYAGQKNDNEWKNKAREDWVFGYIAEDGHYTNIYT